MAYEQLIRTIGLPNGAGRTIPQFTFVNVDSSGYVQEAASGAVAIGVTQDPVAATDIEANVQPLTGISKVLVGGSSATLTAGQNVTTDSAGAAVTATGSSGNYISGIALQTGTSGQIVPVALVPLGKA